MNRFITLAFFSLIFLNNNNSFGKFFAADCDGRDDEKGISASITINHLRFYKDYRISYTTPEGNERYFDEMDGFQFMWIISNGHLDENADYMRLSRKFNGDTYTVRAHDYYLPIRDSKYDVHTPKGNNLLLTVNTQSLTGKVRILKNWIDLTCTERS